MTSGLVVRWLPGLADYGATVAAMQEFTARRGPDTADELWLLEHPPVYTLGLAGRPEHVLAADGIPVVRTDRGGQVTYHGPGQLVAYTLLDLRRAGLSVRGLVLALEDAVIRTLAACAIDGAGRREAPGVYVEGAKIASLGLRVRRGGSYHGLALNVAMDLSPFTRIDPCGYRGQQVTDLATLGVPRRVIDVGADLAAVLPASLDRLRGS